VVWPLPRHGAALPIQQCQLPKGFKRFDFCRKPIISGAMAAGKIH
jgi:hypothetical protein